MEYYNYYIDGIPEPIGKLRSDRKVLIKVCRPEHFFIKFNGFGINKEALDILLRKGLIQIRVKYLRKNASGFELYKVSAKVWQSEGVVYKNNIPPFDLQYILPKSKMTLCDSQKLI